MSRRTCVVVKQMQSNPIEGEDTDNPLICQIMNLCFCWVPSHCGIEGNEIVDRLVNETLDHDMDPLATVHFADLKPLIKSYVQW